MAAGEAVHSFECFSTLIDRHEGLAVSFTEQDEYKKVVAYTKFSKSKPLHSSLIHSISHSKSSLKAHVRAGVLPDARRQYWLTCLKIKDEDVVLYSKALGQSEQSKKLCADHAPQGVPSFSQKPLFSVALERVLDHMTSSGDHLSSCPMLPIIAHVFLHILEEWECYVGLVNILTRQGWVNRNPVESTASLLTLTKLLSTHLRSVDLTPLKPIGMGESFFYMEIFSEWYLWPFVTSHYWFTVRVVDMYLVEGPKALYRMALAAVKMFHKSNLFDLAVKDDVPLSQLILYYLSSLSLEERCDWIRQSLNLPRLKTDYLLKLWLQNCSLAEEMSSNRKIPLPLSENGTGVKRSKFTRELKVDPSTEILDQETCNDIEKWLPEWVQGDSLKCLFQASKHGYNLRTLYRKCEDADPLVIVIRSTDNAIFGALLVGDLKERHNNTFFGSGETVLFALRPHPKCYEWSAESDLILRANDDELIVGSGGGQFGIWIDGDLDRGSTATCSSYQNMPLTGDGKVDFKCAAVEVFSIDWVNIAL